MSKYPVTARITGRADVPLEGDEYSFRNLPVRDVPDVDLTDANSLDKAVNVKSVTDYIATHTNSEVLRNFVEQHEITTDLYLDKKIILQQTPHDLGAVKCEMFSGSVQVNKKSFTGGTIVPNFEVDANEPKWFYFRNATAGEHLTNEEHSGLNEIGAGSFIRISYQYRVTI